MSPVITPSAPVRFPVVGAAVAMAAALACSPTAQAATGSLGVPSPYSKSQTEDEPHLASPSVVLVPAMERLAEQAQPLSSVCDHAAASAAREAGVPLALMRAVARVETGRRTDGIFTPWPWTVNMEGEGRWFDDPESLLDWVEGRRAAGARSFDLGCFQINHLWHGNAFPSLRAMLDPEANALYAARFLRELHDETGSWETAAGHYHSRTPDLASKYRGLVNRQLAALGDAAAVAFGAPTPANSKRIEAPLVNAPRRPAAAHRSHDAHWATLAFHDPRPIAADFPDLGPAAPNPTPATGPGAASLARDAFAPGRPIASSATPLIGGAASGPLIGARR